MDATKGYREAYTLLCANNPWDDNPDWCRTRNAAVTALIGMIFATICTIIGMQRVRLQNWSYHWGSSLWFSLALLSSLVAIFNWTLKEGVCDVGTNMSLGVSMGFNITASVLLFLLTIISLWVHRKESVNRGTAEHSEPLAAA